MIYTLVNDGYEVSLFRSAKAVAKRIVGSTLCLDNEVEAPTPASEADIISALRKNSVVRLFPVSGGATGYIASKSTTGFMTDFGWWTG